MQNTRRLRTFVRDFLQKAELPRTSTAPAMKSEKAWNVPRTNPSVRNPCIRGAFRALPRHVKNRRMWRTGYLSRRISCQTSFKTATVRCVKEAFLRDFLSCLYFPFFLFFSFLFWWCSFRFFSLGSLPFLFCPFPSFPFRVICFPFLSSPFLFFSLFSYFSSINLLFIVVHLFWFSCSFLFVLFVLFVTLSSLVIYVIFSSFHVFHFFPCHFHLFAWLYFSFLCVYIYIYKYTLLSLNFLLLWSIYLLCFSTKICHTYT